MAAMQELRDGGSVAMLSAVNDLYELLTFNEVMQDISCLLYTSPPSPT